MASSSQPQLPATRHIAVCVDDFGLHEGINRAALDLAERKRVSAISCLVDGPAWHSGATTLRTNAFNAEIGLHLNFTEALEGTLHWQPLPRLIALSYARLLNPHRIRQSILRQFDRFESTMGRLPDFFDGHQHVHQLPVIRDALIKALDERQLPVKPWIRTTRSPAGWAQLDLPWPARLKSRLIGGLGAPALTRLAIKHGHAQNAHLLGVYGFDSSEEHYLHQLAEWFGQARAGDLLMCHPSLTGPVNDPLLRARQREYRVLAGNAFSALAESAGIVIGRLRKKDE